MGALILYVDSHDHPTCIEKFNGVRRFASIRGWRVLRQKIPAEIRTLRLLLRKHKPLGCIVNANAFLNRFPPDLFAPLPVVYLDTDPAIFPPDTLIVCHDSFGTGTLAARELLSLHLKNYYYLPYKKVDFWCEQRWKGFSDAIAEAGFPVRRLNHSVFRKKLSLPASSGVMAANDEMAELFLSAAKRIGVRVPHDIAVISADDSTVARRQAVTSIRIDFENGGYRAAKMLAARVERKTFPSLMKFGDVCVQLRNSTRHFSQTLPHIPEAIALIREKACAGLTAADVVRAVGAPRRTVEDHFRKSTGHSILQEIQSVKIESAFDLLSSSAYSISEIVGICGYRTPQAMRKAFRRHAGISMREWQKRESMDCALME